MQLQRWVCRGDAALCQILRSTLGQSLSVYFLFHAYRAIAIRCIRSQWERPNFAPHPSETPEPILMSCQIYYFNYYVPSGVDVEMWFELIWPLWICAYVKNVCVDFYRAMLCIRGTSHRPVSVCLSVTSLSSTITDKRRITQTTPHGL